MLAIEGPTVISSAPCGTCLLTHWPASRPRGTPPVPARELNLVVDDPAARTVVKLGTKRLTATPNASTGTSQLASRRSRTGGLTLSRAPRRATSAGDATMPRAAETAIAGIAGNRYC